MNAQPLLEIEDVSLRFGGVVALQRVTLSFHVGELVGLIGANGSGKTSLCNVVSGVYVAQEGTVRLTGRELVGLQPHEVARLGVARTFQGIEVFGRLTVLENVLLGRDLYWKSGVGRVVFGSFERREAAVHARRADWAIELFELDRYRRAAACDLPYGIRKRVELARAVAMEPQVLVLDEPTAGMNLVEKADSAALIARLNRETELTVIVVEHDVPFVRGLVERLVVLDGGSVLTDGQPDAVLADHRVVTAYLGSAPA